MAVVRRSNGTILFSGLTNRAARAIVEKGHGAPTVAGDVTFADVTTLPALDTLYAAATSVNPVAVKVSDVHFVPVKIPES
jgi:hypothetical protein